MLITKQINLYSQIKHLNAPIIPTKTHVSAGNNALMEICTYEIETTDIFISVTKEIKKTPFHTRNSYSLTVKNNGGLENMPHFYKNKFLLARKVYNHMNSMKLCKCPVKVPHIY